MKYKCHYADEACGMVRYDSLIVEAEDLEEAKAKCGEISRKSGPGFFFTKIEPTQSSQPELPNYLKS